MLEKTTIKWSLDDAMTKCSVEAVGDRVEMRIRDIEDYPRIEFVFDMSPAAVEHLADKLSGQVFMARAFDIDDDPRL